jgi:hypothetical protein
MCKQWRGLEREYVFKKMAEYVVTLIVLNLSDPYFSNFNFVVTSRLRTF